LYPLAAEAKQALGVEQLEVVADKGFYNAAQIRLCAAAPIMCYVRKALTSANTAQGLYGKERFR
jgi:hypothetical protein